MTRRAPTADPRQLELPLGAALEQGAATPSPDAPRAPSPSPETARRVVARLRPGTPPAVPADLVLPVARSVPGGPSDPGGPAAAVGPAGGSGRPDGSGGPAVVAPPAGLAASVAPRAPSLFRHPRAVREIDLGRAVVAYAFQRARRRSIGMVVSAEGLSVRAPRWVGWAEIEAALREKAGWIEAKLLEQHERARRHAAARIEWCDGTGVPYLGGTLTVRLDPAVTGARLDAAGVGARLLPTEAGPGLEPGGVGAPGRAAAASGPALRIGLPKGAEPEQIRDVVQAWLKRQARRLFEERCAHYAPRLGVQLRRLALSSAQTRWGSASVDGSVRLNWRLIHFALPTIDYVVAHELAHLREMNHSPRFWDVVRSVIPDVDAQRGALRQELVPAFE